MSIKEKELDEDIADDCLICICAFRYALGRRTYVPGHVVSFLEANWGKIDKNSRFCIERDLDEEIRIDDDSRERGENYRPLGDNCDRETWLDFQRFIKAYNK